ncbi:MAG: hypothetical protein M3384_22140 [Acidobacteriota bacterium]|nr:hypothetical protein [Acidobacteriota bacterium]
MKVTIKNNLKFEARTLEDKKEKFTLCQFWFLVTATAFCFPGIIKMESFSLLRFVKSLPRNEVNMQNEKRFFTVFSLSTLNFSLVVNFSSGGKS